MSAVGLVVGKAGQPAEAYSRRLESGALRATTVWAAKVPSNFKTTAACLSKPGSWPLFVSTTAQGSQHRLRA